MTLSRRISMPVVTLIAALAIAPASFAQSPMSSSMSAGDDHSSHHVGDAMPAPARTEPTNPMSPPPSAMPMATQGAGGMMGQGIMGQGMMGGDMKPMMSMMRNMMTMMSADSGMMASHVEGRIAALKTELKITEAQNPEWSGVAGALRATAKSMNGMHQQMMQAKPSGTLPERITRQEAMLSAHLATLKALSVSVDKLYASLDDDQKKIADGLMVGPMGMM